MFRRKRRGNGIRYGKASRLCPRIQLSSSSLAAYRTRQHGARFRENPKSLAQVDAAGAIARHDLPKDRETGDVGAAGGGGWREPPPSSLESVVRVVAGAGSVGAVVGRGTGTVVVAVPTATIPAAGVALRLGFTTTYDSGAMLGLAGQCRGIIFRPAKPEQCSVLLGGAGVVGNRTVVRQRRQYDTCRQYDT